MMTPTEIESRKRALDQAAQNSAERERKLDAMAQAWNVPAIEEHAFKLEQALASAKVDIYRDDHDKHFAVRKAERALRDYMERTIPNGLDAAWLRRLFDRQREKANKQRAEADAAEQARRTAAFRRGRDEFQKIITMSDDKTAARSKIDMSQLRTGEDKRNREMGDDIPAPGRFAQDFR